MTRLFEWFNGPYWRIERFHWIDPLADWPWAKIFVFLYTVATLIALFPRRGRGWRSRWR